MLRSAPHQLCLRAGLLAAAALAFLPALEAQPRGGRLITTIREISALSPDEVARSLPVKLRGVVTYSDPEWGLLFLQDGTGAIFIDWHGPRMSQGQLVEVTATTARGHYSPILKAPEIRATGMDTLPEPKRSDLAELDAGKLDSFFVDVAGVVRQAGSPWNRLSFWIQQGSHSVLVVIPAPLSAWQDRWNDSVVRIRGVCGSKIEGGKRTGAQLFVSRVEDVQIEMPGEVLGIGTEAPAPRLLELSRQRYVRRVRLQGELVFRKPGLLWVETPAGSIPAMPEGESPAAEGDSVEVTGFPAVTALGPALNFAAVRKLEAQAAVRPRPLISADGIVKDRMHGRLVRVRGRLLEQKSDPRGGSTLLVESGAVRFAAELAQTGARPVGMGLPRGGTVELLGVAVQRERQRGPEAFTLMVREVKVLPESAFLSWQFALTIAGLFLAALAAFAVWLGLLRRTVRRQTAVIRARLERESQLESEYRRLFERNLAAVFRFKPDGAIVDCNPAFARMLGLESREALLGGSYWQLESDPARTRELEALAPGESVANRKVCLQRPDGSTLWLEEYICRVDTPQGSLFEATAIDVTERRRYHQELEEAHNQLERRVLERTADLEREIAGRKRVEEELLAAKQHAEDMSLAKSTFLANMSHELRTPLNAIIGYSEMLIEDAAAEDRHEWSPDLERIRTSARHLLVLINDVLDLAKIEAGRMDFRPERFSVAGMVEDVVATVEPMARKANNRLEVDYSKGPADLVADPTKFRQSLLNLLSNACKFTEGGEVSLTVQTVLEGNLRWVDWAVADNGIGIAPEHQHKIFESFSQVDATATRKYSGTGLGLAISRRYCQHMGGDITFTSEPGRGSRFVIRMPADQLPAGGDSLRSVKISSPAAASEPAR